MSFGNIFDGYCVIHAPFVCAERRPWFERELARVGVKDYTVVEAQPISDADPRLSGYTAGRAVLSALDAVDAVIALAEEKAWQHVVFMEDDVIFRRRFAKLWDEVEAEVQRSDWDVLCLYRIPSRGAVIREPRGRTTVVPLLDAILMHCVVYRESSYRRVRESLQHCVGRGWPPDFFYGYFTREYGGKVKATSRNLAGQMNFRSSIQERWTRGPTFYSKFRTSRSWPEYVLLHLGYLALGRLRRGLAWRR
jgi:hypothetical protein